jgi:hypothetical protein
VNFFTDRQPMRHYCDDRCEAVYRWTHPPPSARKATPHMGRNSDEAMRQKARGLVSLANNAATAKYPEEANTAARLACRIIAKYHLLDPVRGTFTVEDWVRWAQDHGVI